MAGRLWACVGLGVVASSVKIESKCYELLVKSRQVVYKVPSAGAQVILRILTQDLHNFGPRALAGSSCPSHISKMVPPTVHSDPP